MLYKGERDLLLITLARLGRTMPLRRPHDDFPIKDMYTTGCVITCISNISKTSLSQFGENCSVLLGGEPDCPNLLESFWISQKLPALPQKFHFDFSGSSLTVDSKSNPEVPLKFSAHSPNSPRSCLDLARSNGTAPEINRFLWEA